MKLGDKVRFKFDRELLSAAHLPVHLMRELEKHSQDSWKIISKEGCPTGEATINRHPCMLLYNPKCKSPWATQGNGFFIPTKLISLIKKRKFL